MSARRDTDDDGSANSNFNRCHPGFDHAGGASPPPSRTAGMGDGSPPPARELRSAVIVGDVLCLLQRARGPASRCHVVASRPGRAGTHVDPCVAMDFDFYNGFACSPSSVMQPLRDPMLCEAALLTPNRVVIRRDDHSAHSFDLCPCRNRSPPCLRGRGRGPGPG